MKNTTRFVSFALLSVTLGSCGGSSSPAPTDAATALSDANLAAEAGAPTRGAADALTAAPGCEHAAALCTKLNQCAP